MYLFKTYLLDAVTELLRLPRPFWIFIELRKLVRYYSVWRLYVIVNFNKQKSAELSITLISPQYSTAVTFPNKVSRQR